MENENKHPEPNYKLIAKYLKLANYDNYRYNLEIFRNDYIKNNCVDFEEFIKQLYLFRLSNQKKINTLHTSY